MQQKLSSEPRTGAFGRRDVLGACAAAVAGATVLGASAASARGESSSAPYRIDTHSHQITAQLHGQLVQFGLVPPNPRAPFVPWSLDSALAMMDANRIQASVLSAAIPDTFFASADAAMGAARGANESMAATVRATPSRFGFFAYLPLPYVDQSLAELAYAFDTLKADGVLLMAHAGGKYLGDPLFDPVLEELNRRRAVVLTHPNELPGGPAPGVYGYLADYMLDTTRAGVRMIQAGTLDRYPDLKIILPHGGGFLPYMASRLELGHFLGSGADKATVMTALRSFYYDTAMWTSPYATPSLLRAADPGKVLYGTDFNVTPVQAVAAATTALDEDPLITPLLSARINRVNALSILPGLKARIRA